MWFLQFPKANGVVRREKFRVMRLFGQNEFARRRDLQTVVLLLVAYDQKPGAAHQFAA
jgi:hypothetical protein